MNTVTDKPKRQMIERYGDSGFRVSGIDYTHPILILVDRVLPWAIHSLDQLNFESLAPIVEFGGVEILLIGCGRRMIMPPAELKTPLKAAGIVADTMDTGAACRTFNVLTSEERHVAAALFPLS